MIASLATLGACDTGDGTTLRDPTAPTTLPPDTTLLPAESIDDSGVASDPVFESVPASTLVGSAAAESTTPFELTMPWATEGAIDLRYTCDGIDATPALSWTGVPDGAVELAVSMVNDSDVSNGRPFIHWVMAGIDPSHTGLAEDEVPPGAVQGINFLGDVGYTGPCPEPGTTNTYTFTVHALAQQTEVADDTPAAQMLDLIDTVAIGSATSSATAAR